MRIIDSDTWRIDFKLREPYTIAYDTYDSATNLFVRLDTDTGLRGYGCASPAPEVTGESIEECAQSLEQLSSVAIGVDPRQERGPDLEAASAATPAAAAALDMALLDLRARDANVPLCVMLGGGPSSLITSVTLGIEPLEATLARGRDQVAQGFRALKVKGGNDVDTDIARICGLRRELGPEIDMRFDANQGYDVDAAVRFARGVADANVVAFEQPTPASDSEGLAELTDRLRLRRREQRGIPPVLADESLLGVADAVELVAGNVVDGFTVKLMKAGGITPARAIDQVAATSGLPCMLSCMDEAALGIAAGLHFALAAKTIQWVDLDGHLDLLDDPTAAAVSLRDGRLTPGPGPGLGVQL